MNTLNKIKIPAILVISIFVILSSAAISSAKSVYVGAYIGPDSQMPTFAVGGGWDNNVTYSVDREMVNWQGKNFAFEETFMNFDSSMYINAELEFIWSHGRVPLVNLTSYGWMKGTTSMKKIAHDLADPSSTIYIQMTTWAQDLKTYLNRGTAPKKRFLLLALFQEGNYNPYALENDPGTWDLVDPVFYKQAYRAARGLINNVLGSDELRNRVQWMFAPNNKSCSFEPGFEEYYPGDDVVDWLGLSAYNFGGFKPDPNVNWVAPWQLFDDFARPYLDRLTRMAPRKPLTLTQFAGLSFAGDKDGWIESVFKSIREYPMLYIVTYFNVVTPFEFDYAPGLDFPVFWNDAYVATAYGVSFPAGGMNGHSMAYPAWLESVVNNSGYVFSSVPMPPAGLSLYQPGMQDMIALGNTYNLLPEIRNLTAGNNTDTDGDGIPDWLEIASGLNPLVNDRQASESNCSDGVDNDANGRTDADDTYVCGGIGLNKGEIRADAASLNEYRLFRITLPRGVTDMTVTLSDVTGGVSLYAMRFSKPDPEDPATYAYYWASPALKSTINSPASGTWYILVKITADATYKLSVDYTEGTEAFPRSREYVQAVACDLDGNGQDDLVGIINGYGIQAFLNKTSWVDITSDGNPPSVIACAKLTEDSGTAEIVALWPATAVRIYSYPQDTWTDLPANAGPSYPSDIALGKIDDDGNREVLGTFADGLYRIRPSSAAWTRLAFPSGVSTRPDILMTAKLDGDDASDIVAAWNTAGIYAYMSATHTWKQLLGEAPSQLKASDMDGDGRDELAGVFSGTNAMRVRNSGTGVWSPFDLSGAGSLPPDLFVFADIEGNRKADVVSLWENIPVWNNGSLTYVNNIFEHPDWVKPDVYDWTWRIVKQTTDAPVIMVTGNFNGDVTGRNQVMILYNDRIEIYYYDLSTYEDRWETILLSTCANKPVKIATTYYLHISDTYKKAVDNDVIQCRSEIFNEDLLFDNDIIVTLKGGYDCNYTANNLMSTIAGYIEISAGTVTIENIVIKP